MSEYIIPKNDTTITPAPAPQPVQQPTERPNSNESATQTHGLDTSQSGKR